MHSTDIIGHTYQADIYCTDCGDELPDIDPEGNEKGVIFAGTEFDYVPHCGACHEMLEGFSLTDEGVNSAMATLLEVVGLTGDDLTAEAVDAMRDFAHILTPYLSQHTEDWSVALVDAARAGDYHAARAAHVEATTDELLVNAQAGTLTNSDMRTARELLADNGLDFRRGDKLAIAALIAISQGGYTEARLYTLRHDDRAQQQAVYARAESRISDYLNRLDRV